MKLSLIRNILFVIGLFTQLAIAGDGILNVTSYSSGAQVKVNGQIKGYTPFTLELGPGEYTVEAGMIGYASQKKKVKVINDDVSMVEFKLEVDYFNDSEYLEYYKDEVELGRILITSDVPKSYISFNGGRVGGGNKSGESMLVKEIYPGLYKLRINKKSTYLEIVDGSLVKAHFDGNNFSIDYDDAAKAKLSNYQASQASLEWISAADGIPRAQRENKPVIIVSSKFYEKELEENKAIFDEPTIKDYLKKNYILIKIDENSNREVTISGITTTEADLAKSTLYNGYYNQKIYAKTSRLALNEHISQHALNEVLFFEKELYSREINENKKIESSENFEINSPIDWIGKKPVIVIFYSTFARSNTHKPLQILEKMYQVDKSILNNVKIIVVLDKEREKQKMIDGYVNLAEKHCPDIKLELPIILDDGQYFKKYNIENRSSFIMLILNSAGDELERIDIKRNKNGVISDRIKQALMRL